MIAFIVAGMSIVMVVGISLIGLCVGIMGWLDRWLNTDEVKTVESKPFRKPLIGQKRSNR